MSSNLEQQLPLLDRGSLGVGLLDVGPLAVGPPRPPSLHQRRLWQKERRLEEDVARLNLLIAAWYAQERVLAARELHRSGLSLLWQLRVAIPLKAKCRHAYNRFEKLKRSRPVQRITRAIIRIVVWLKFNH